jgi:hypothetical protein
MLTKVDVCRLITGREAEALVAQGELIFFKRISRGGY